MIGFPTLWKEQQHQTFEDMHRMKIETDNK